MNRRRFLLHSASFLAGSLLGFDRFSKALAFGGRDFSCSAPPSIALIIDDIGFSSERARMFLQLEIPLTFSILPCLDRSFDLAVEIHERGHEVMLHQPMEPYNQRIDPGPGALYQGFSTDTIGSIIEQNINSVPFAVGMNNHMGSKFTECRKEVADTLSVINREGMFFVDSLTTSHSTAYQTAKTLHIPTACRNRFLDVDCNESAIRSQLHKLVQCALKYGHALGIGHPFPETAAAIQRFQEDFERSGVKMVPVSHLLKTRNSAVAKPENRSHAFGDFT